MKKIALLMAFLCGEALPWPGVAAQSEALWRVEQVCIANFQITGASFPCLDINLSRGAERGFAVLRPPAGKKDSIVAPTMIIAGIEDPSLQAPDAPNYFEDAWNALPFLSGKTTRNLARDEVALAVNSRITRSEGQLHIHFDCISGDVRMALRRALPKLPDSRWMLLNPRPNGQAYWARRLAQDTLSGINPFTLVAREVPFAKDDMGLMTVVITGVSAANHGGFILLAARTDPLHAGAQSTGEDLLDHSCST